MANLIKHLLELLFRFTFFAIGTFIFFSLLILGSHIFVNVVYLFFFDYTGQNWVLSASLTIVSYLSIIMGFYAVFDNFEDKKKECVKKE